MDSMLTSLATWNRPLLLHIAVPQLLHISPPFHWTEWPVLRLPSASSSSKLFTSFRFSYQELACIFPRSIYATCPAESILPYLISLFIPSGVGLRLVPCWDWGEMDICLLRGLCVVRYSSWLRADHSSRGDLPSVIVKPR